MTKKLNRAMKSRRRHSIASMRAFVATVVGIVTLLCFAAPAGATSRFGGGHGLPICREAGCLYGARGVAVDPGSGDVYVAELYNNRVSVFDREGKFLFAFGYGVLDGKDEPQTCTVATNCTGGLAGSNPGQFSDPGAVAVDSEGYVYVADLDNHRVEKFKPEEASGKATVKFVSEFGSGTIGEWSFGTGNILATGGPHEDVYVGDKGRVDVFERSGVLAEQISTGAISATGRVGALAVAPVTGDVFVQIGKRFLCGPSGKESPCYEEGSVFGVHELEPNGTEKASFDSGGFATALTINNAGDSGSGDLYVADPEGGLKILGYHTSSGKHFQSFDPEIGPLASEFGPYSIVISSVTHELYMTGENWVWVTPLPPPGPILKGWSVTPERQGAATFKATIDPEGNPTSCQFEYIESTDYAKAVEMHAANPYAGGKTVTCEPALGEGFTYVNVTAHTEGLTPGATYHWRVIASNVEGGVESPDQSFEETPAALVDGPWVAGVSSSAATLNARVDPLGSGTSYRLEYGTSTAYEHVLEGNVGAGDAYVAISYPLSGLRSGTVYHYRLITTSVAGTVEGSDRTFVTQLAASGLVLLDGRSWEQVSPVEKHGADVIFETGVEDVQAAAQGNGLSYIANGPLTETPHTSSEALTVVSTRSEAGWGSIEPMPGKALPPAPAQGDELLGLEFPAPLSAFDLSRTVIEPSPYAKPLSPEATERTLYVYDRATGVYTPLVTPADDGTGSPFGGKASTNWMQFRGATPDLSHIVFESPFALTKGAVTPSDIEACEKDEPCNGEANLYEWSAERPAAERLQPVNVLPDGEPVVNVLLGRGGQGSYGIHAVSADGRWVVWTLEQAGTHPALYVRDIVGGKTYRVGGKEAIYETMNSDGSRIFYLEGGDLYMFDTSTQTATDITVHGVGEANAGVLDAILGASEDGKYVYVMANGDLTGSQQNDHGAVAQSGKPNVYVLHDVGSGWSVTYIATLSSEDEHDWSANALGDQELMKITSHVSPEGLWLAFMSNRSLTGYDNVDAQSGVADEEVFLYSAQSGRLVCASCNPTGERPRGALDQGGKSTLVDPAGAWEGHWLAGSVPGWRPARGSFPMYQPRVVFDSGRLFFQSFDALVPLDTNGLADVYEYEPVGVGTCTEQDRTFNVSYGGCVDLVSSGTSLRESAFYDASRSGNDVFFSTSSKLAWTDIDEATDVYDARVDGGFPEPVEPPACEGDACQGTATSPIDETPSSLTFYGHGNIQAPVAASAKPKRCRKGTRLKHGRCVKRRSKKHGRKSSRRGR